MINVPYQNVFEVVENVLGDIISKVIENVNVKCEGFRTGICNI